MRVDRPEGLGDVPLVDLAAELLYRLEDPDVAKPKRPEIRLMDRLREALLSRLESAGNRFSAGYLRQIFGLYYGGRPAEHRMGLPGGTFVELGCGSENPLGLATVMKLLGADRAFGLDFTELVDPDRAIRAVADVAALMLLDPSAIVGDLPVDREQMWKTVRSVDMKRVMAGDWSAIDTDRVGFLHRSVLDTGLADSSVDCCASSAFLEHVPEFDRAIAEIGRITKSGGLGIHLIDYRDHGFYSGAVPSPIEFLLELPGLEHVRGCNRVRASAALAAFDTAGFELLWSHAHAVREPEADELGRLLPEFRDLSSDDLSTMAATYVFRRR